jgi:putative copper export protein
MLLVGAPPTLSFVVFPELERRGLGTARARRVALPIVGVSLAVAVLAGTVLAVGNARAADVGSFAPWVGATTAGRAWTAFIAVAALLGVLTAGRSLLPDRVPRQLWLRVVSVGALVMLVAFCWTRFSTAVDVPAIAILVKFTHMTGGALWVGGLAILALLPTLVVHDPDSDSEIAKFVLSVVRQFSILAVAGVTAAFATGVIIAAWHVPTPAAVVTTSYGALLSVKVGLVLVAAAIGGFNRFVIHEQISNSISESHDRPILPGLLTVVEPRIAADDAISTVARSVRFELLVLTVAIGLSVVLTTVVTPSYELLEPTSAVSGAILGQSVFVGFAALLKYGAIGIALTGSLALGYEMGKLDLIS